MHFMGDTHHRKGCVSHYNAKGYMRHYLEGAHTNQRIAIFGILGNGQVIIHLYHTIILTDFSMIKTHYYQLRAQEDP